MIDLPPGATVLEPRDSLLVVKALTLLARLLERRDGGELPAELLQILARLDRAVRIGADSALAAGGGHAPPAQLDATPAIAGEGDLSRSSYDVSTQRAAQLIGCSDTNVRALAQRGTLPGRRVGRFWQFRLEDVIEHRDRAALRRQTA